MTITKYVVRHESGDFFCSSNSFSYDLMDATLYNKEGTAKGVATNLAKKGKLFEKFFVVPVKITLGGS